MQIQNLGLTSFKISTKEAIVVTDPYSKESGLTPSRFNTDLVILSEKNNRLFSNQDNLSGDYFLVPDSGEYDVKGVTITGIPLKQDSEKYINIFLLESEDIKILNLTHIKNFTIKANDLDDLGDIDILILPIGDHETLPPSEAGKIINTISPKIVIPSYYQQQGLKVKAEKLEEFTKNIKLATEELDKLVVKKKDLQFENTKLVILKS